MKKTILGTLGWTLIAFGAAGASLAHADAVVRALRGEARVGNNPVHLDQRIYSGTTINTGPGALLVLKFDDGQQVVLNETTTFRITDFRYREAEPRGDRAVFDLLQGALRFVTGIVGSRNRESLQLRVPQATIGVRGTDFMVALVNQQAYVNVTSGAVGVTNGAGTVVLGAGTVGSTAGATSLAVTLPASALPAEASGAFANLAGAQLAAAGAGAGGAASGASGAAVAAPASAGVGTAIAVGVAAGVIGTAMKPGGTTTSH